jgi:chromosomal replication initiation ATPase DnaA
MNYLIFPALTRSPNTIANIVNHSCKYHNVDFAWLKKPIRDRKRVAIRQMVFKCLRVEFKHTFSSIAKHFDMDHTTVIHGIAKLNDLMDVYPEIRDNYLEYIINVKKSIKS